MPQAFRVEVEELVHRRAYSKRPQPTVASDFRRHVNATGRPETFPTISTTPPPPETKVIVLSEIHISKSVRGDDTYAPCPICNPRGSQFLHGYLVWCEEAEAIYAIGKECADSRWEAGLLDRAVAAYEQQQREVSLEIVLLEALPRIRMMTAWADQYQEAAQDADRLSRSFRRSLSGKISGLETAAKTGGYLYDVGSGGGLEIVGQLTGSSFCLGPSHIVRDLRIARQYLAAVDFGGDEEVLIRLQAMSLKEKRAASDLAARARGLLLKVSEGMAACWDFTRPENLAVLNNWGGRQHDRMSAVGDGRKVRIDVGGKHWFDHLGAIARPSAVPKLREE